MMQHKYLGKQARFGGSNATWETLKNQSAHMEQKEKV